MDGFFITILVLAVVGSVILFIAKVFFVGFLIKKGVDAYLQHQQAFDQALRDQQALLHGVARRGRAAPRDVQQQFQATWLRAQSELNQLDAVRRQQAELRLTDMTSQAASLGVYIDPSSL